MAHLSLEVARRMVDASVAESDRLGHALTIAVCDAGGHALVVMRMDDAPLVSLEAAVAKARTAVYFRRPTGSTVARSRVHPTVYTSFVVSSPVPLVLSSGGYPLWDGDRLVGGVAAAGALPTQDAIVVARAQQVWEAHLSAARPEPGPES